MDNLCDTFRKIQHLNILSEDCPAMITVIGLRSTGKMAQAWGSAPTPMLGSLQLSVTPEEQTSP